MPTDSTTIKLLLVDDHPAVREGLALLLAQEQFIVSASASTITEALTCISETWPDVALVDLSLGNEDGATLVVTLHERGIPTLVYSMHEDARHIEQAFAAGALGYVTKRELHRVLIEAINAVADGRRYVSAHVALALTERVTMPALTALSGQETVIFLHLGKGESTQEIAIALDISVRTVETYCARMQEKLQLPGMHALRRHAIAHNHR